MSLIKKLSAIICVLALMLSFAGCHKKDEIAVTVGDIKFTSAYYMCAFVTADSSARQKVSENLTEAEQTSQNVDIYSKKIDGKKYADWVKDTALDDLKKIAAYKTLCQTNKIELDAETKAEAAQLAAYRWSSYGFQALLEPNGVSEKTFNAYILDTYYASSYFEFLYGKGGKQEISADEVNKALTENFEIANVLEGSYKTQEGADLSDKEKADLKAKFEAYVNELKENKRTFEEIYKEFNKVEDEETEEEHDHEHEDGEEKELEPVDKYASLLGSDKTDYQSDHFKTVKEMTVGEIKLVELEDKSGIVILVRKDVTADPYYIENLDMIVRNILKGDEYEKTIDAEAKKLKLEENTFATGQFKVKKIVYPEQ